jgi:hypothetical protein
MAEPPLTRLSVGLVVFAHLHLAPESVAGAMLEVDLCLRVAAGA